MFILRQLFRDNLALKDYRGKTPPSALQRQAPALGQLQHSPVFFMTEVKLLRMELIFARSTFARFGKARAGDGGTGAALTTLGAGGVGGVWAGVVTVTEVVLTAAVAGATFGAFSAFTGAEGGAACFSFLSSTAAREKKPRIISLSFKGYLGYEIFFNVIFI